MKWLIVAMLVLLPIVSCGADWGKEYIYHDINEDNHLFAIKVTREKGLYYWYFTSERCTVHLVKKVAGFKCPNTTFVLKLDDAGDVIAIDPDGSVAGTYTEGANLWVMFMAMYNHASGKKPYHKEMPVFLPLSSISQTR